jgi:hypothetical protein
MSGEGDYEVLHQGRYVRLVRRRAGNLWSTTAFSASWSWWR